MDTYTQEILTELKALREEVANLKKPMTKEEILAIKNDHERHEAIRENMELFKPGKAGSK